MSRACVRKETHRKKQKPSLSSHKLRLCKVFIIYKLPRLPVGRKWLGPPFLEGGRGGGEVGGRWGGGAEEQRHRNTVHIPFSHILP